MRRKEKKAKQNKTILLLIIKTINNYDNKNDKIRWWYRYRIEKLMAKVKKIKSVSKMLKIISWKLFMI